MFSASFRKLLGLVPLALSLAAASATGLAQNSGASSSVERGVMVREAQIYLAPDTSSAKLAQIQLGREVAILERGAGQWLHVLATLREGGEQGDKSVTGWLLDKGVVRASTPNGERILFGEAAASEAEAMRRGGRKGAELDALRLYYRTWEYFPKSEVAGEALYRAADIRWQLDRAEVMARPSARQAEPIDSFEGIDERMMRDVKKKFPGTKWAALADFAMIENKLCGDWQLQSKCPQREAERYEEYAKEYPQSPKLQEALYQAARRRAALIQIFMTEGSKSKSDDARQRALSLAQRAIGAGATSDWGMRAQALAYRIEQQIPVFGNVID